MDIDPYLSNIAAIESSSSRDMKWEEIIRSFQELDDHKKNDYIKVYIEKSRQNSMTNVMYVSLDQHILIFNEIGKPINSQAALIKCEENDWNSGEKSLENVINNTAESDSKDQITINCPTKNNL